MKLFLDTSSLFKLYHNERNSDVVEEVFSRNAISGVYLSELSKIEFASAIWKKVRSKELTTDVGKTVISLFEVDFIRYHFIPMETNVLKIAQNLLSNYGASGLRTLDSIQFATALFLRQHVDLFLTSDSLLESFFVKESLNVIP